MILSVSGIRFGYNSHPVLDDVTFHLEKGQILCILGVNGAGKSTLLKCLNRILKVRRGSGSFARGRYSSPAGRRDCPGDWVCSPAIRRRTPDCL